MMTSALKVVGERVEARLAVEAGVDGRPSSGEQVAARSPRQTVRDFLIEMLPIDEARYREGQVGPAFHTYAGVRPRFAAALRADTERLQGFLATRIRDPQHAGYAHTHLRPEQEARIFLALVEGLSIHVLGQGYDPAAALSALESHLETIFTVGGREERPSTEPGDRARGRRSHGA